MEEPGKNITRLFENIRQLIEETRIKTAVTVNAEITLLYWKIGKYLKEDILKNRRAYYGQKIIASISTKLTETYGKGWSEKHLRHCLHIKEIFPDEQFVYTLCRELSWSHIRMIMYLEDSLKREFYIELCKLERWSVRQLNEGIQSMLYERTAISKKPDIKVKWSYIFATLKSTKLSKEKIYRLV